MIVMMIAITPSLNASNLPLGMLSVSLPVGCSSHADRFAAGSRASDGISNSKMQARLAIDVFGIGRNGRQGPIKEAARA